MGSIDRLEITHTLDARRKKRRIAERLKDRLSRCSNRDFTDKIQSKVSLALETGSSRGWLLIYQVRHVSRQPFNTLNLAGLRHERRLLRLENGRRKKVAEADYLQNKFFPRNLA